MSLCCRSHTAHFTSIGYYPCDDLHSAVFAVVRSLSIRLSHAGIVSRRLNLSYNIFARMVAPPF